jgi:signal transduction histidine kinase
MADPGSTTEQRLRRQLEEATAIVEALANQEVDAVVGRRGVALLRLKDMEEALRTGYRELEQELEQRTADVQRRARQLQALALQLTDAEERERRRLAVLLHDGLQQQLVAIRLHIEVLSKRVTDEACAATIGTLQDLVAEAIQASRSLSVEISPPALHHEGLAAALQWLADDMREKHRLTVELEVDPAAEPVDDRLKVFLFQGAREMLFNVVKHAGVDRVRLGLAGDDSELQMTVEDKGRGFDPDVLADDTEDSTGFGLVSLRERGELLGAAVEIDSAPSQGTRVSILCKQSGALLP